MFVYSNRAVVVILMLILNHFACNSISMGLKAPNISHTEWSSSNEIGFSWIIQIGRFCENINNVTLENLFLTDKFQANNSNP